jgi:hypothetical protein
MKGLIGKKVGMTQLIADDGRVTPVTIIEAGPCFVTQVRTPAKEGYHSVQLGFEEVHPRRLAAGERGHLKGGRSAAPAPPARVPRRIPRPQGRATSWAPTCLPSAITWMLSASARAKASKAPSNAIISTGSPSLTALPTAPARRAPAARPRPLAACIRASAWPAIWAATGSLRKISGWLCGRRAQLAGRQRQRARRQGHRRHYPRAQPVVRA